MSEAGIIDPTSETAEKPTPAHDVAVDYGGYFGAYMAGRNEYDKPADSVNALKGLMEKYPGFSDTISLLRSNLERAWELRRGFYTPPVPSPIASTIPPDYTFSSVRDPRTRPLLDLLNIAMVVDDETAGNPQQRAQKLKTNGQRMIDILLGENAADPRRLIRITDADVLIAVFEGRLILPPLRDKPLPEVGIGNDKILEAPVD